VINCAGAWSPMIAAQVGLDLPVTPFRRELAITEPLGNNFADLPKSMPMTIDYTTSLYWHREGDGILMGFSDKTNPPGFELLRDPNFPEKLGALAEKRAPRLLDLGIRSGWSGLYEVTPDHNALLGEYKKVSRFFYATGFSGHGFLQGPAIGEILRDLYLDKDPFIDIAALSAAPLSITPGATNGVGSSLVAFARADHVHGAPTTWTPSSHTHAYTDLLPISNSFAFTANTISLYNTNATNSFTLNPNGSVVLAATTLDLVGVVKINGVTITGSSSSGGGSSSSGSSSSSSYSSYFLKNTTIGAVTKNLTMDGSDFYSSVNQIKLAANSSFGFRADISAATSTGNAGALWVVEGVVRRSSDISSITLQDVRLVNSYVDPSLSSCSVSVDVDAAIFGSLIFYTQGTSSLTIYWTADVTMFGDPALLPVAPNAGGGSGSSGGSSSSITFPAPGGSLPSVNDDADYGVYVLKGYSTSASSVRLTTDGLVSTISNVPILSDNTSWVTDITVAAHVAGTSAGVWKYSGLFRRGASASSTTFLGPLTQEEIMDANFESAVVSILPDTTFGGINISVTGLAGISSNWIAVIHATELR